MLSDVTHGVDMLDISRLKHDGMKVSSLISTYVATNCQIRDCKRNEIDQSIVHAPQVNLHPSMLLVE